MILVGAGVAARALVEQILPLALGSEWNVYAFIPDGVSAPAAAIVPRQPYREVATHCVEAVHLTIVLLRARSADPAVIQDQLDLELDNCRDALVQDPRIVIDSVAALGVTTNVGGTDYTSARLDITVNMTGSS